MKSIRKIMSVSKNLLKLALSRTKNNIFKTIDRLCRDRRSFINKYATIYKKWE